VSPGKGEGERKGLSNTSVLFRPSTRRKGKKREWGPSAHPPLTGSYPKKKLLREKGKMESTFSSSVGKEKRGSS